MDTTLKMVSAEARGSDYFKVLNNSLKAFAAVQPGRLAPDFTLMRTDSTKLSLSGLRGKYILIDFWASWCVPCREGIPHLKEIFKKYQNDGFDILSVSSDKDRISWLNALKQENMTWNQVIDESLGPHEAEVVVKRYSVSAIPLYLLIGKDGLIILRASDEHVVDKKLRQVFGH